jgi:hypothetical protein
MNKIIQLFNKNKNIHLLAFSFWIILAVIGGSIIKDYGLGWDDEWSRIDTGYNNFNYVFNGDKTLLTNNEKYHGPFVELMLVAAEKVFDVSDISNIYLLRHIVLFSIFMFSLIAFYLAGGTVYGYIYALIACLMIVVSPRIFTEAFYNSKDIAFLSFINFAIFTYFTFNNRKNLLWAFIHGLFSAILIDIRILGIMIPMLTIGFYILDLWQDHPKKKVYPLIIYIITTVVMTILFWPVLWEGPIHHFSNAFMEMKKYHWDAHVFFNGKSLHSSNLPWYYLPMWIFITTPFLYSLLWITGILFIIGGFLKNPVLQTIKDYKQLSILVLFFAPVLSVIVLNSVVYDGWRHLYFIYPFFLLIGVHGLKSLTESLHNFIYSKHIIFGLLLISMALVSNWMIKNHPFENVYFNTYARTKMEAGSKFELDYWGLSYKQGLEYILKTDKTSLPIRYTSLNLPGKLNQYRLPLNMREKLQYVEASDTTWQYYLTNYRGMGAPDNTEVIHKIKVNGINIMGIYKKINKK